MRFILNIIWLVLCGLWMAIGYALAGLICFALFFLVITIPFGIAAFRRTGAPTSSRRWTDGADSCKAAPPTCPDRQPS